LNTFSGTDTSWNKVNFHVIFSNKVDIADIRAHFLGSLEVTHSLWQGKIVDQRTLAEFGKRIIENIPTAKRRGNYKPEDVGNHYLTFDLKDLQRYLNATAFKDRFLTAVGKAEWANMRWETAIPDKYTIIDSANLIFTAGESPEACHNAKRKLADEGITVPLLDCSDAHHSLNSKEKDRLGHCYTWLKADTTFVGLRQVLNNPEGRIYLGDRPDKLTTVEQHPTKFIRSVTITKAPDSAIDEIWFNNTIELSHDFVAIIGNKGMGKSALTDIIALTSNSDAPPQAYGFLDENHFRDEENKAADYIATTMWHAGPPQTKNLSEPVTEASVPLVRYIPQHYFEDLCNETSNSGQLQRELQKVIYSHLDDTETLGHPTLQALIDDRTSEADRQIAELRARLGEINNEIIANERATTAKALATLQSELTIQQEVLTAHDAAKPQPVDPPPVLTSTPELDHALNERRVVQAAMEQSREKLRAARVAQSTAINLEARIDEFGKTIDRLERESSASFTDIGLHFEEVVRISVDSGIITARREELDAEVKTLSNEYETRQSELEAILTTIATLTDRLDEPNRAYQRYLEDQQAWEDQRREIVGTEHDTASITELTSRISHATSTAQTKLAAMRLRRALLSTQIHEQLLGKASFQRGLYQRLQEQLSGSPLIATKLPLQFNASLIDSGFTAAFNEMINHGVKGAFADEEVVVMILRKTNINDTQSLAAALDRVMSMFLGEKDIDNIERQRKKAAPVERIYNFLFGLEYLDVRYSLRIKGRELLRLTPGERGSVLLVFYLLADKDDRPLIIDQPEENLDNQSVYELVVPCIKEAKQRRQIIMVTHNPNLAVVCDAEQIIWCEVDKEEKNKVTYRTGSIENPEMNKHVVDVLEGTWRAFTDRGKAYHES
jgi:ABC-type lipoprotein export system ATPase subunit